MTDAPDPSDAPAKTTCKRLWGGRFGETPDELMASYTASINIDLMLYQQDIEGSRAHVRMLARRKIIEQQDADKILAGLDQVETEIDQGELEIHIELEDIHTHVEARLAEIIGPTPPADCTPAGRATIRSRSTRACSCATPKFA